MPKKNNIMEVKFTIPEAWVKTAKEFNIPDELLEEFFQVYLDSVLGLTWDCQNAIYEWADSDDYVEWMRDHGLLNDDEDDEE